MSETRKAETSESELEPGEALFQETAKQLSIFGALRAGVISGLLFGYHGRLTYRRVEILRKPKPIKRLEDKLAALTDQQSSHFLGLASVNKDQVESAFRYTAIINFTAPITLVVVINQVFPNFFNWVFGTYLSVGGLELGLIIALFLFATVWPVFQAYVSVGIARDLYHIALIDGARRGHRPDAGPGGDIDAAPDPNDL